MQSRARAAQSTNVEALKLYLYVGGYVSKKTRKAKWGIGAIDALSCRLQVELPGLRGFSPSSIKRMRSLFEEWNKVMDFRPSAMGESEDGALVAIRPSAMGELTSDDLAAFLSVGFTHHSLIVEKVKPVDIEGENLDCVAGYDGEAKSLPADIAVNGEPKGTVTMTYDESVGKWRASTPDAASGDTLKVTLHPDPAKPDVIQEDAVDEGEVV